MPTKIKLNPKDHTELIIEKTKTKPAEMFESYKKKIIRRKKPRRRKKQRSKKKILIYYIWIK